MKRKLRLSKLENLIASDQKFSFTLLSYAIISIIFINLSVTCSPLVGGTTSLIYLLVNGTLLGRAYFEKEDPFLRLMLGNILLIAFLGLISWAVMIIYDLDTIRSVIVLCVVTALSSLSNKRMKPKNVNS